MTFSGQYLVFSVRVEDLTPWPPLLVGEGKYRRLGAFARDIYAITAKNFVILAKYLLSMRLFISQRRHDNYRTQTPPVKWALRPRYTRAGRIFSNIFF